MKYELREKEVRIRLNMLLDERKLSQNSLAGEDSATQKRLNRQLSHSATITLDTIVRVLDACPDVSADWLLRGEVKEKDNGVTGAHSVTGSNATVIGQQTLSESFVKDLLAEKDRTINKLLTIIERCEK